MKDGRGWFNESHPHALAARGVKLGREKKRSNIRLSSQPSPRSSRYDIRIDRVPSTGKPISAVLYDRKENKNVESVGIYDIGNLGVYKLTKAQYDYIDTIEKQYKESNFSKKMSLSGENIIDEPLVVGSGENVIPFSSWQHQTEKELHDTQKNIDWLEEAVGHKFSVPTMGEKTWGGWESETREVRRPSGPRMVTTRTKGNVKIITAPRRPQYLSVGKVYVDGELVYDGPKDSAEEYVKMNRLSYTPTYGVGDLTPAAIDTGVGMTAGLAKHGGTLGELTALQAITTPLKKKKKRRTKK